MNQQVTPYLLYEDGESAIAFAMEAFGFQEVSRAVGSAGGLHAEMEVQGGGRVFFGQPPTGYRNPVVVGRTSQVIVMVDDVDAHFARAKATGARIIEEPNNLPFGQRRYGCADPQGHEWYFAQPIEGFSEGPSLGDLLDEARAHER
jgi:uncharacterized glyoxalase superfamily protein PhnB